MTKHKRIQVGEEFVVNCGTTATVTRVDNSANITVIFNSGYTIITTARQLRTGKVADRLTPSVYGVGFIGVGEYPATRGSAQYRAYLTWVEMLRRCYDKESPRRCPSYTGCTVDPQWHNFQNFAHWCIRQRGYSERHHLDKDLTVFGNRVYSEQTCSLVPHEINSLLLDNAHSRGKLPIGVSMNHNKFCVRFLVNGRKKHITNVDSPEEAFAVYKKLKEDRVKMLAEKYKDFLTTVVYNNLVAYTVSITD